MPCAASRRNISLRRMRTQHLAAPHLEAEGCCVRCWGRGLRCVEMWSSGLLRPMLGQGVAVRRDVEQWAVASDAGGRGAVRRDVEHGIGRREDPADCRLPTAACRRAGRGARAKGVGAGRRAPAAFPWTCTDVASLPPRPGISPHVSASSTLGGGGVSEWPKERASKARVGASPPRVRIPAPPPRFYGRTVRDVCHCTRRLSGNATGASAST